MSMQTFLKRVILGGIFLVPFLPFAVSTSLFFPFIAGKGFAFRIIVEIIFACWLLLAIVNPSFRPKKGALLSAFIVFVAIIGLADIFGQNPAKSIWSNYERMEGWILLIHLLLYTIVISTSLKTEKWWRYFWNTSLLASSLVSIIGVFQLFGVVKINQGDVRLDAYIGNSTYLAVYLLFHIFIALFLYLRSRKEGGGGALWAYLGVALLDSIILYHTATRGAILGLIFGIVLTALLVIIFGKKGSRIRKLSAGCIGGLIILALLFVALKNTPVVKGSPVLSRFASISLQEAVGSRSLVWSTAWQGFKDRPLLGWGQENFNYVFNNHYNPLLFNQEQWFDRTHNIVFDWLIAGGILGLLSYGSILVILIGSIWKMRGFSVVEKSLLTGLIGGYIFQNLFVFDNLLSYILFASVIGYIISTREGEKQQDQIVSAPEAKANHYITAVVVVVLCFGIYFVNAKGYLANRALINSFIQISKNEFDQGFTSLNKALAYKSFGTIEIREQTAQIANSIIAGPQISDEIKQKFFALGVDVLQAQIQETPKDVRHYVLLGSYLNSGGQFDGAIEILNQGLTLSPKKQIVYFEIATSYINKKDYAKAFEFFTQAYELAPKFPDAKLLYAIGAIYAGEDSIAEEQFAIVGRQRVIADNRVISAYQTVEKYTEIVKILEERIALNPDNSASHLSLAAAYMKVNRRTDAIAEIQEAIRLNPEIKEQGEFYITEIRAGRNP